MKTKFFLLLVFLGTNQAAVAESGPDIKEGQWEVTSTTQISGMPTPAEPMSTTISQCMKKQDAADPKTMMQNQNCTFSNLKTSANSAEWEMSCQQEGMNMTGSGKMNYQPESYDGVMTTEMQMGDTKMVTTTQLKGRYVGPCK